MNPQSNPTATSQRVELGARSYEIHIGFNLLEDVGAALRETVQNERVLVLSDRRVARHYGDRVLESLLRADFSAEIFTFPEGELSKSCDTLLNIYNYLIDFHYGRDSTLVALGGGVTGDIGGFAAASYVRGIPYVQMPTSLLAMVDSSIGGKTGINHPRAKNMIGAFYQPRLVQIDLATLRTLDPREFRAGFAEVIKYGVIWSQPFFEFCADQREAIFDLEAECLMRVVNESCAAKAAVVARDENESGLRAILNFGHTVGHALESITNYTHYKHGEAVSIGMVAAARMAAEMQLCPAEVPSRIEALCAACGLPVRIELQLDVADILERMKKDKKVRNRNLRFVLPTEIGKVEVRDDVEPALINQTLTSLMSE